MEDEFYSTIKLKSGEEIFAKVCACDEDDKLLLLVFNPIIVNQIKSRNGMTGYKIEPWLKTTTEDTFIIDINDVITMSESNDIEMMMLHESFVQESTDNKFNSKKITRDMGYISTVNEAKSFLEKIYKNS